MIYPMRRLERAVTDWNHVLEIIQSCDCCRVAFSEPDGPYIVPMNFGIESSQEGQMVLYFHGASAGKKGELMQKNPCVGFEMDTGHVLVPVAQAYSCSFLYQSVIGKGKIEILSNLEEKKARVNRADETLRAGEGMGFSFGHVGENSGIPAGCDRMELQGAQQMKRWWGRILSLERWLFAWERYLGNSPMVTP